MLHRNAHLFRNINGDLTSGKSITWLPTSSAWDASVKLPILTHCNFSAKEKVVSGECYLVMLSYVKQLSRVSYDYRLELTGGQIWFQGIYVLKVGNWCSWGCRDGPSSISILCVTCRLSLLVLYSTSRGFSPRVLRFSSPIKKTNLKLNLKWTDFISAQCPQLVSQSSIQLTLK